MRVLISGAGLAGLTAAYWLKRYGFTPTIVERAPSLRTGGYKIDVRGTALQVLQKMGIYELVAAAKSDMQGATIVDKDGNVISEMSGDAFGLRRGADLEIIRGKLCEILMNQIPDIEYIFDDSITELSQSSNSVQVTFEKNGTREFDLVIGADGLHSKVRRLAFGDESKFVRELGLYLCVFTVPNYLNLDRWEIEYTELGRIANIWSSRGDAYATASFGFVSSHVDLDDKIKQLQIIRTVYEGVGWEVPRLLQALQDSSDYYFDSASQVYMNYWSQGRVVLVGDAGYCPSPLSGQGSSVALIGAYVLAGELAAARGNYQSAFDQYEKEMRPFIECNQALGIKAAKLMRSIENKSIFFRLLEQIMRLVPGRIIEFYINRSNKRINKAANSINLKDYSWVTGQVPTASR